MEEARVRTGVRVEAGAGVWQECRPDHLTVPLAAGIFNVMNVEPVHIPAQIRIQNYGAALFPRYKPDSRKPSRSLRFLLLALIYHSRYMYICVLKK